MEIVCNFRSIIKRVNYSAAKQILKVTFVKSTGLQERTYNQVPKEIGCKLIYAAGRTARDLLQIYSTQVKGKYQVIEVKQPKF